MAPHAPEEFLPRFRNQFQEMNRRESFNVIRTREGNARKGSPNNGRYLLWFFTFFGLCAMSSEVSSLSIRVKNDGMAARAEKGPQHTSGERVRRSLPDSEYSWISETTSKPAYGSDHPDIPANDEPDLNLSLQTASQMLFYMNHSADACEDLYEYACGGFEANHLMSENDLAKQATKRIFNEARKSKSSGEPARFLDYYQSCVAYTKNEDRLEKMKLVIKAVNEVGNFYAPSEWSDDKLDFTTMLSSLLLRNSAPLFDITPDVAVDVEENCAEQMKPARFTLQLGPPVLESSFYRNQREADCNNKLSSEITRTEVNLTNVYQKYKNCTSDLKEFLGEVQAALNVFNITGEENIETRYTIELDLVPAFDKSYPAKGEVRKAYLTKDYTPMTVTELQKQIDVSFLNWTQLLQTLTNSTVDLEQPLQVYFPSVIEKGLNTLLQSDKRLLHNALLGLYAHKIYKELGLSSNDVGDYCERVATSLMGTHASSLYLSSFSHEELAEMKVTVTDMFEELKHTFESEVKKASWLRHTPDTEVVKKIRDLTIETPDMSYYQGDYKLNTENGEEEFTGRFFDDTIMLQKNHRKSMYAVLKKSPNDYEQTWTHFALPYQTSSSAVHELNKIVIPYGAVDWSAVWNAKKIFSHHLILATLGSRIAQQISHHFLSTGAKCFADKKSHQPFSALHSDVNAADIYRERIDIYKSRFNNITGRITVPSAGQNVHYEISDLSLNERISDILGLQLAYETMLRLPSNSKKSLPWFTDSETDVNQQFFLAYTQMHCTKVPLAASFRSLYENEYLPSRLRILVASSNNAVLGNAWQCPMGSNVRSGLYPDAILGWNVEDNSGPAYTEPTWSEFTTEQTNEQTVLEPKRTTISPPAANTPVNIGKNPYLGKKVASRMLFYMNHSADACEDFYEYACGGFEAHQLISENDLAKQATQRIFDQAKKGNSLRKPTKFLNYYQSCVAYNKNENKLERMKLVIKAVNKVGEFYGPSEWTDDKFDFTTMLSSLMLRNSAPLFDITPDVAVDVEENCAEQIKPARFTLQLGPPVLESSFYRIQNGYDCYNKLSSGITRTEVNLKNVYQKYKYCTSNLEKFLEEVGAALDVFNITDVENLEARYTIELDLLPAFDKSYPAKGEVRKAYLTKNYTPMTVGELQKQIDVSFLNWTQLLQTLTNSTVDLEQPLQVYFPSVINQGLNTLLQSDKRSLHNALLGLYAHKIYKELGLPSNDVGDYCERVATSLMGTHASSLYLSSFSHEELAEMKVTVTDMFKELKDTFESEVKKASWLKHTADTKVVKKIRDLTIETPDISYYQGDCKLNTENNKEEFTGRFFDDTIMLQKNYRKSMYAMLEKSPNDYEQIWTHFALPYQTTSSAIYGLNKIIVPYGAIDWLLVSNAKKISSGHLVLATLGTTIANQIAHHFDHTGVHHFAGKKVYQPPAVLCSEDSSAAVKYQNLIEDYKLLTHHVKSQIVVQSTNQRVTYTISDLSLNDRLADITGLQIAYNTMLRLSPNSKKLLPWLATQGSVESKQFFLAHAQMYCTKRPLTASFVSLYEDEHLPSRLRISTTASSIRALTNTWNCSLGSNVHPELVPITAFPYLENPVQSSEP